jgi:membrane protein DedA with SNARE-associated domain
VTFFSEAELVHLVETWGAWFIFALITLESLGLPLPAESALLATSIYAGTGGRVDITAVTVAAMAGAILGDNIGYLVGRTLGQAALRRFGHAVGLTEERQALARYLFRRHGGKVVLFGRFVAFLRVFAAVLAGANAMPWGRFFAANAAGGILWAGFYGIAGYALGADARRLAGAAAVVGFVVVVIAAVAGLSALRRGEKALIAKAMAEEAAAGGDGAHAS